MSFWKGFEKQAVSLGWVDRKLLKGLAKRTGKEPSPEHQKIIVKALTHYHRGQKPEALKAIKTLSEKQAGVKKLLDKVVSKASSNPISNFIANRRLSEMQVRRTSRMFEHGTKGRHSGVQRAANFADDLESAQSKLAEERKEVSTVALIRNDKILMGKRNDNGRYTNPGGHLDQGEDPADGAVREVKEETGVDIDKGGLVHIRTEDITTPKGQKYRIHAYKYELSGPVSTSMKEDPDAEVRRWSWIDIKNGLPKAVLENLHSPKNVLLRGLGLQPEEHEKTARVAFRRFEREFKQAFGKILEPASQEYVRRKEQ